MNAPLTDDLFDQLRGGPSRQIGEHLDLSPQETEDVLSAALPLLIGMLARNVHRAGADDLYRALADRHRGRDPGNVLATALAGGREGAPILDHVFGTRAPLAAQMLGSVGGLGETRAARLLEALAPVVLAFLARRSFTPADAAGPDTPATGSDGLAEALDREIALLESREGYGAGLLASIDDGVGSEGPHDQTGTLGIQTAEMRSPRPMI